MVAVICFGTHGPNVAASNGQAVARYVLRERVSTYLQVHAVILERPCLLSTGQSLTDSDKAANAAAILSKMAIHLSKSNFDSWGVVATMLPLTQAAATYSWPNESIKALYILRLEGIGFKHRVFLPKALEEIKLISGTLWQADKHIASRAHSLAAPPSAGHFLG